MSDIKWEDPPRPVTGSKGKWASIGATLRARPGEWALVASGTTGPQSARQVRVRGGFGPGVYETTTRKRDDGTYDHYARYIGESA